MVDSTMSEGIREEVINMDAEQRSFYLSMLEEDLERGRRTVSSLEEDLRTYGERCEAISKEAEEGGVDAENCLMLKKHSIREVTRDLIKKFEDMVAQTESRIKECKEIWGEGEHQ